MELEGKIVIVTGAVRDIAVVSNKPMPYDRWRYDQENDL